MGKRNGKKTVSRDFTAENSRKGVRSNVNLPLNNVDQTQFSIVNINTSIRVDDADGFIQTSNKHRTHTHIWWVFEMLSRQFHGCICSWRLQRLMRDTFTWDIFLRSTFHTICIGGFYPQKTFQLLPCIKQVNFICVDNSRHSIYIIYINFGYSLSWFMAFVLEMESYLILSQADVPLYLIVHFSARWIPSQSQIPNGCVDMWKSQHEN